MFINNKNKAIYKKFISKISKRFINYLKSNLIIFYEKRSAFKRISSRRLLYRELKKINKKSYILN